MIILNNQVIATGYAPDAPPPVAICHDWVRVLRLDISAASLRAMLQTGRVVTVGNFRFEWSKET